MSSASTITALATVPSERLTANLRLVEAKNPALAQQLQTAPMTNLRLGRNARGDVVGQSWDVHGQQWIPLCDPEDPWAEAERDVEALYTPDAKIFTLLGLGLGYFATAFAKRLLPYQRMAIFEANPSHYLAALHTVDLEPLLGGRHVDTFLGDNLDAALQQWWLGLQSHEKFHIASPMRAGFTGGCDQALYDGLMMRTMDMHRYHAVGLATWRQFGSLIGDNDLGNLPEYMIYPGLGQLTDLWKGRPAVCIAAGPSLTKNLRVLADPAARRGVALLSVGTVYALLQHLGIIPDIVTTIDFQRLNWGDQFHRVPLDPQSTLVYLHSTYPTTPRRWPGPKFVALNSSDTVEWMRQFTEPKPPAAQVQTVAHLNLVTALHLGANPIILMGQDLSMPKEAHHAPGARAQDQCVDEAPPETHVPAEDIYGKDCWTRHSMLSMRTVFQQIMAANPDRTFLNCTEGGLHIEGAQDMPLRLALESLPTAPDGAALAPALRRVWQGYTPETRWDDLHRDFQGLQDAVQGLHAATQAILEHHERWSAATTDATRQEAATALLALEPQLQAHPVAFGLFAVRRFDVIELLSGIPPAPDTPALEVLTQNVERLAQVAAALQEEMPVIRRLLDRTKARLDDVTPRDTVPTHDELVRMLGRESIPAASQYIPHYDDRTLTAQLLRQRNQYAAAAALYDAAGLAPGVSQRCQDLLAAHHEAMQPMLPAYFAGETAPAVVDPVMAQDTVSTVETLGVSALPLAVQPAAPIDESERVPADGELAGATEE